MQNTNNNGSSQSDYAYDTVGLGSRSVPLASLGLEARQVFRASRSPGTERPMSLKNDILSSMVVTPQYSPLMRERTVHCNGRGRGLRGADFDRDHFISVIDSALRVLHDLDDDDDVLMSTDDRSIARK